MTQTVEHRTWTHVDKSTWPRGPWDDEPDKEQWQDPETGLACLLKRNSRSGFLCGYVGVPESHAWHGKDYTCLDVTVHGDLTYASPCQENGPEEATICHVVADEQPVWWLGFDCAHWDDMSPGLVNVAPSLGGTYRTVGYVKAECASLAAQIAAA